MGLFCANLHVRTEDDKALAAALGRRGVVRYRLLPAKNGWTSLYEERASQQDDDWIRELGGGLSRDLHAAVIAFLVHDSDIACYWLFDGGRLVDDYNSCPDYFDDAADSDEPSPPRGGRTHLLLPYCRKGVATDDLEAILTDNPVFAEDVIERLAGALGIDRGRALGNHGEIGEDGEDDDDGGDDDDDGDDDDGDSPRRGRDIFNMRGGLAGQVARMLGVGGPPRGPAVDPRALGLVEAAARGDADEVDRLLAAGAPVDAEAPAAIPSVGGTAGLTQLLPNGLPKFPMTPLLAAVVNKQRAAALRLLDAGADPNGVSPVFGTPVHAATGTGDVEILQLLIDRGGDASARNLQGLTPLQTLSGHRATRDQIAHAQAMVKSLGMNVPHLFDHLANITLPTEGWDACERLLKAQGAD